MNFMEVGIREAKNNLSKLVQAALEGEEVYLTKRGERTVQIVATPKQGDKRRGWGLWEGKTNLYPGWDSPAEDKKIEEMFDDL